MSPSPLGIVASARTSPAAPTEAYPLVVMADSPLAYWRLGELSGVTALDSSGNARALAATVAPGWATAALLAQGVTDTAATISAANQAPWRAPESWMWVSGRSYTVEAWIKTTNKGTILSMYNVAAANGSVACNFIFAISTNSIYGFADGKLIMMVNTTAGGIIVASSASTVNDGIPHHVAAVVDNTAKTVTLYIDGVANGTPYSFAGLTLSGGINPMNQTSPNPLVIGASTNSSNINFDPFNGALDEVAMYGTALSATRVSAHYAAGKLIATQPSSIVVLGDSTGDDPGDWLRLLSTQVAKAWPTAVVQHRLWNGTAYATAKTLWNGGGTTTTIYNGHFGSTTADYPIAVGGRLAAMVPVDPDVVVINYGHNHTTESAATFEGKLDTLLAAVQALYPATPVVISSQNHQKSPATNAALHNTRQAHLATYAGSKGYGYIGAYEAFQAQGTPNNFVQSDGVHPTSTGAGDGSHLWAAAAKAVLFPAASPAYAALTFAQRMLALSTSAWYRLGETSGTVMNDSSVNARHGTYVASPTLGVTGALPGDANKAVTFNGSTQYGYVPYASWMDMASYDFTIAGWVKSTDADGIWLGRVGTGQHPYFARIHSSFGFYVETWNSSGSSFYVHDGATANVRDGNWHFLVVTFRDGYLTTYVDGVQKGQNTSGAGPSGTPKVSVDNLFIAAANSGPFLAGSVDEPAIMVHALTPSQIAELYAAA